MKIRSNSRQILTCICVVLLNLKESLGAFRVGIRLNSYDQSNAVTTCADGLVVGDSIVFYGNLTAEGDLDKWNDKFSVVIGHKEDGSSAIELCTISVYTSDCGVASSVGADTVCRCVNYTGSVLTYEIRFKANLSLSEGEIQTQWNLGNGIHLRSKIRRLPAVYEREIRYLLVNGSYHPYDEDIGVNMGDSYGIQWCVDNLATGSVIEIRRDGIQVAVNPSDSKCTTNYYFEANENLTYKRLQLSYSESTGCSRSWTNMLYILQQDAIERVITLVDNSKSKVCKGTGLVVGEKFTFYGTLNTSGVDIGVRSAQWQEEFIIGTRAVEDIGLTTLCNMSTIACDRQDEDCYCENTSNDGTVLDFVVSGTVVKNDSEKLIKARWSQSDVLGKPKTSETLTIPIIYDRALKTINLNMSKQSLTNHSELPVHRDQTYVIKWCVDYLKKPSYVDIIINNTQRTSINSTPNCASFVFQGKKLFGATLTFFFIETTGCQRSEAITKFVTEAECEGTLKVYCLMAACVVLIFAHVAQIIVFRRVVIRNGKRMLLLVTGVLEWVALITTTVLLFLSGVLDDLGGDGELSNCDVRIGSLVVVSVCAVTSLTTAILFLILLQRQGCQHVCVTQEEKDSTTTQEGNPDGDGNPRHDSHLTPNPLTVSENVM